MHNPAALVALVLGGMLTLMYGWIAWKPISALASLRSFPRTVWPGRLLAAICVLWFSRNLWAVDLGGFNGLKNLLYVAAPVAIYLIIVYIPDLLSVRGVCVLILLAGQPVLATVRWTGTPASVAVAMVIYAMLIKCMVLVVYPHLWIRGVDVMSSHPGYRKKALAGGFVLSAALLLSGFVSYAA